MSNIGWFAWEPGLFGNTTTSAGGAAWTAYLFERFVENGHHVIWLPDTSLVPQNSRAGSIGDCDIVFFCWRWQMPEKPERHQMYLDQLSMVSSASRLGIPIVVHDEDHKISYEDRRTLDFYGATIARPELFPEYGVKSLIFPNPYEFKQPHLPFATTTDLVYVGNNYERYIQTRQFLRPFSSSYKVTLYGNWLEPSSERESPEKVLADFPRVEFPGRLPQEKIIDTLWNANSTIHLFRPSYARNGFITIRWAEAAAAGIPAFVPWEMALPEDIEQKLTNAGLLVEDGDTMVRNYAAMTPMKWVRALEVQRKFVREYMTAIPWLELVDQLAR